MNNKKNNVLNDNNVVRERERERRLQRHNPLNFWISDLITDFSNKLHEVLTLCGFFSVLNAIGGGV